MKKILCLFAIIIFVVNMMNNNALAYTSEVLNKADALNYLGLFQGTDNGYELDKSLTRSEAVAMVVRYLGAETESVEKEYKTPFTDVPQWAEGYIGYAYSNGITDGISDTEFGSDIPVSLNQYLTFMLRVLGYDDRVGDFTWLSPYGLAQNKNLIGSEYYTEEFYRANMVDISWNALDAINKSGSISISEQLIGRHVITSADYAVAKSIAKNSKDAALQNSPIKSTGNHSVSANDSSTTTASQTTKYGEEISYKVIFYGSNGKILDEQILNRGESAIPPENPSEMGMLFLGWSHSFYNIIGDTKTTAKFAKENDYNIFYANSVNTSSDGQFTVNVDLRGTVDVCAYDLSVEYNPDVIELEDYETNPILDIISERFDDDGEIKSNMVNIKNIDKQINIMNLTFRVKDLSAKSSVIKILPHEVLSADKNDDYMPKDCEFKGSDCVVHIR